MRQLISNVGGRRFVMTIGCGVVSAALLWCDKLTSGDYTTITIATVAAYIGGNTYQKTKGVPD